MPLFVDTSVLVYARDSSEPDKQARARQWLDLLWRERQGRLSTQVLEEFYVTVTRHLEPGMALADARADVEDLSAWGPVALDDVLLRSAWSAEDRFAVSFSDALILAAAGASGCDLLLSEDFSDGRDYGGIRVANPFLHAPGDIG